jgi:hypothetical protein
MYNGVSRMPHPTIAPYNELRREWRPRHSEMSFYITQNLFDTP